jgi:arginyl-tRNA synthetase
VNIFNSFKDRLLECIEELQNKGELPKNLDVATISVEPPRNPDHGDVSTNAALLLAGVLKRDPREIANLLADSLAGPDELLAIEVAGPGFLNARFSQKFWHDVLGQIIELGEDFGLSLMGGGKKIILEFVSANPTGPLHIGHARGAIFGDTLARLLVFTGYDVLREYYWNDSGAQVDKLAKATYWRYLQSLGLSESKSLPNGATDIEYKGNYLVSVGAELARLHHARYVDIPEIEWISEVKTHSVEAMKQIIRDDLALLDVKFDSEVSEEKIMADGRVEEVVTELKKRNLVYTGQLEAPKGNSDAWEKRDQMLFRSTKFGDEIDRPLTKSDGSWTYFATDIAYHLDKYSRGFKEMANVWGADHGGYVPRVRAAVNALTDGFGKVSVALCQMVRLFDHGQPIKMSKRSGNFVTVRELVEAMDEKVGSGQGKDVIRFIMLTRKNDAPLDFDFSKASEQSRDNPVFYVQYAHARICSVFRRAEELGIGLIWPQNTNFEYVYEKEELALLKLLSDWPRVIELASNSREPHRIVFYLNELASEFHSLWNMGNNNSQARFIVEENSVVTRARLALIEGVRIVLVSGLQGIVGVTPQIEMR